MKVIGSDALRKTSGGIAGLMLLLVILIAANVILGNMTLRADLTEEKLYTLSSGTVNTLANLDQKVTLKFFFTGSSSEVPMFIKSYAKQVEDLLQEYKVAAGRRIVIEKYDPTPDSDAEEWAQRYGVASQPVDMFGAPMYLGLVAVAGNAEGVLPSLDPRTQELLEYNITRLIYRVAHPEKPVIGVLSSLPVLGTSPAPYAMPGQPRPQPQPAWLAFRELQEDYEVRQVKMSAEEIDADIRALIVVQPKGLSDATLYAIDQFVLGGGHALIFLDPMCLSDAAASPNDPYGMNRQPADLSLLLDAWGVGYEAGKVLADMRAVSRIQSADNRVEESPVWLTLSPNNISRDDVLTTQLESLMLPLTGVFADYTSKDMSFTPLLTSSETSCMVNSMTAQFGGQGLRRELKSGGVPLHMATRLTGVFKTAFPEGMPSDKPEIDEAEDSEADAAETNAGGEEQPGLTEGKSTVILVADADMLQDRFCVNEINFFGARNYAPLNDNLNFFANAVEQMAGSDELIGTRSRGRFNRPFDRVLAIEQNAGREWQAREADLVDKLNETQRQLRELQTEKDPNQRFILNSRQKKAIEGFRQEELRIKRQLKDVRKNLRRDIELLGVKMKVINIALMPLLVSIAGVSFGIHRKRKKG